MSQPSDNMSQPSSSTFRALSACRGKKNPLKRTSSQIELQKEEEQRRKDAKTARKTARKPTKDATEATEAAEAKEAKDAKEALEGCPPERAENPYLKGIEDLMVRNAIHILRQGWTLQSRLARVYKKYVEDHPDFQGADDFNMGDDFDMRSTELPDEEVGVKRVEPSLVIVHTGRVLTRTLHTPSTRIEPFSRCPSLAVEQPEQPEPRAIQKRQPRSDKGGKHSCKRHPKPPPPTPVPKSNRIRFTHQKRPLMITQTDDNTWVVEAGADVMVISHTMHEWRKAFCQIYESEHGTFTHPHWFREMFFMAQSDDPTEFKDGPYSVANFLVNGMMRQAAVVLLSLAQVLEKVAWYDGRPTSRLFGTVIHHWWKYVAKMMGKDKFMVAYTNYDARAENFTADATFYQRVIVPQWQKEKKDK